MGEEVKKISFGFSKLAKKTSIVSSQFGKKPPDEDGSKVEFVDCLEGRSIKLKDPVKTEHKPLVIPLKRLKEDKNIDQKLNLDNVGSLDLKNEFQRIDQATNEISLPEGDNSDKKSVDEINPSDNQNKCENLDEIAAREILEELKHKETEDEEKRVFSVPLTTNAPSGEKESTLDDYENIPVTQFGMAMLRGMGWAPGKGIGKNEKLITPSLPNPRPKGMGLGADKVIQTVNKNADNENLKMEKGSFVRVIAGPDKDCYGHVEGFDDESGRLIVRLALKNVSISLSEFMVQLVDKSEFKKNSKVINVSKYEQYKEDEIQKETSEGKVKEIFENVKLNSENLSQNNPAVKSNRNISTVKKKNRSSSSESEGRRNKDSKAKEIQASDKYRDHTRKRSSNRSSRSPSDGFRREEHSRSRSKSHKSQSTKYDKNKLLDERSVSYKKRYGSKSPDSSSSSSNYRRTKENKSGSSKTKSSYRERSASKCGSSSESSNYSNDSRKKKHRHRKKKPSSHKQRSRSRSRSPRKHKHKRSKRCS